MIYIASDHAGFYLKKRLIKYLEIKGYEIFDCGAYELDEADDYPDFIIPCAKKVIADKASVGIVIGGSGQGEAIAANKVKGVRAAVFYGPPFDIARLAKEHNDANVLSLGARFVSDDDAKRGVTLWLAAKFEGGRHQRRIDKISKEELL
ncbi:RpiB/LacA/LacB family sugar-phosphate isomerase [Candidatus Curtissbacteria bacterium]|nr:RpiB/LacA/LacB family sugar-phosphate isomerase [Candidatus Curtissbacteria bacterium]